MIRMKIRPLYLLAILIIIFALLFGVYSISFDFGFKTGFSKGFVLSEKYEETKNGENTQRNVEVGFECPDLIKGYVYREYDKYPRGVRVDRVPVFIDNPSLVKTNEAYNSNTPSIPGTEMFDVTSDGKKESIVIVNLYTENHTPHDKALIVSGGNVIFRTEGIDLSIKENDGNGFVLSEVADWNTGEYKYTRYLYKDGGFLPILTQKSCWVNFE